ncbi:NB-ARC domain-containing protein [Streptomyces sp. NBC_00237]|uniref:AfsR/SARP family transcriptional regulator n=1 Tax=Streptomyces sp. NBC_00237 TaxID=2975687 RepID=UPI002257D4DB|nr:BTAD domain-containing putative transcriptional regulator [Streptomyces sp. NBC_00237]MCX5202700.1 NB-ARC domain-containing protein [Streptomyces sp. NBC_00237]
MENDISFRVLGTVQLCQNDRWQRAGSPQQQAVLAVLLLRAGRMVTADRLVDAVWGDDPPSSVIAVLRTNVWRLRQRLDKGRTGEGLLASVGDGYRLDVPPDSVDALRAEMLAAKAEQARRQGLHAENRQLLRDALALWQGTPLAGVPGPFARQQHDRLEELRFTLEEQRFEADLSSGDSASAAAGLASLSQESPLRERPYALLMRALSDVGRRADALSVYQQARTVLREELGIEPSEELRELQARMLAEGPAPGAPAQAEPAAVTPAAVEAAAPAPAPVSAPASVPAPVVEFQPVPAQLPSGIPDFIGREEALAVLRRALDDGGDTPVITAIAGMGGVGKSVLATRFAHQIKERFPDGQLYADLYGTAEDPEHPKTALDAFLTALGVPRRALPSGTADAARLLRTVLADRRVLVVLDDARDAAQVRPLLPGSAGSAVVITSRAKLIGLPISTQLDLDLFTPEEAWKLLGRVAGTERVGVADSGAERLLSACSRLPLAVRIAAARLAARPQWSVDRLADRLSDSDRRLAELRIGELAVANTFELSHRMLTSPQARAFRLVACVTRAATTLASAATLLALPEPDTEDLLESLVDAALLESPQPGSYRFHDLVREFAEQLPAERDDERVAALERLLEGLRGGAYRAFQAMVPGDPVVDLLAPGCRPGPAFRDLPAARAWVQAEVETAVDAARTAARDPMGTDRHLSAAADTLVLFSPFGQEIPYSRLAVAAEAVAEAAERISAERTGSERTDADRTAGRARFVCGNAALQQLHLDAAETHALAAEAALRRTGDSALLHQVLNDLGLIAQLRRHYADAARRYEEAADVARAAGHRASELVTSLNAAQARLKDGHAEEARRAAAATIGPLRALGNVPGLGFGLYVHGLALYEMGHHVEAVSSFEECLAICTEAGLRRREAVCRSGLADALRALGQFDRALSLAQRSVEQCRERGTDRDGAQALLILGRVLSALGRPAEAAQRTEEALAAFRRLGLAELAEAQQQLAALSEGEAARAQQPMAVSLPGRVSQTSGV